MIQKRIDLAGTRSYVTPHEVSCWVASLTVTLAVVLASPVILPQAMAQSMEAELPISVSPSAPGPYSDGEGFDRRFYVGAGALVSQLEPDADNDDSLELVDEQSVGGSVLAGYDVGNRFTVEAHIASLGEATLSPQGDIAYQVALLFRFGETRFTHGAGSPVPADAVNNAPDDSVDGDGVVDASDRCTDTRIEVPVDEQGCDAFWGVVEGVSFDSGSDRLTRGSEGVLTSIAATLRDHAHVYVAIEAHTDNRGSAQINLGLSRRRALAVARYFASQGVEPQRLKLKAHGESRPRSSNATPEGRAANRRVEISTIE